jgi:DNA-binding response OmpR family regulator
VILVVDDEWMNREMMQVYLETEGYEVMLAHSGDQALEMLGARHPDMVLTDVRMPGMSGYDLCTRLKSDQATRSIPVILITGLEREEDYRRGLEVGADDFVSKPLVIPVMLNRIKSLLRIKDLNKSLEEQKRRFQEILTRRLDSNTVTGIMAELENAQTSSDRPTTAL